MPSIIFDFAQTLAEVKPSNSLLLQSLCRSVIGLELPTAVIDSAYHHVDVCLPYSSVDIVTPQDRQNFFLNYNELLLKSLGILHSITPHDIYNYFTKSARHWHPKEYSTQVLEYLHAEGHKIYILSNFDSCLNDIVKSQFPGQYSYFKRIFASQDFLLEKPNPMFLQTLLDQENLHLSDMLYVGDSYVLDYLPARLLGISAILVPTSSQISPTLPFVRPSLQFLLNEPIQTLINLGHAKH